MNSQHQAQHLAHSEQTQAPTTSDTPAADSLLLEIERLAPAAAPGHYDELRAGGEKLSPDWAAFFASVAPQGLQDMERRTRELARQVRDNGITYNVYADRDGPQRPWSVDLFPLIIGSQDWRRIEAGVLQRARLLELVCRDIYGPQQLLHEGVLPPALVQGHPGYLRAMHGARPAGGQHLYIAAFDMARDLFGRWFVVGQRTEAPSGLGYLLENRMLVAPQFAAAYESMGILPLADVYRPLLNALKRASPAGDRAHIVLLTPGPYNETYFEHAFLARHLGLTLAEGSDLTVREERVYLRTLRGLEPVHALIKRLDDAFLDPLELRADSTLGVPGILQAVRAGNLVLANAPGTGVLESPALLGFMPALAQRLLGESLLLPALDTWWCGETSVMDEAISLLAHGVVKPTYPGGGPQASFEAELCGPLDRAARERWVERIMQRPDEHTVQSYLPLPQMPTWDGSLGRDAHAIVPRSCKLRVFALSSGPGNWTVLPGGLARIAVGSSGIASMQRGGSSADVWVRGTRPGMNTTANAPTIAHAIAEPVQRSEASVRAGLGGTVSPGTGSEPRRRIVTSRAAENLFWLGRYTERSENTLRLARLCLRSLDIEQAVSRRTSTWLAQLAQQHGLVHAGLTGQDQGNIPEPMSAARRLFERSLVEGLDDYERLRGLGFNLRAMKNAASTVRERLSTEQWHTILTCVERYADDCRDTAARHAHSPVQALATLNRANTLLGAITGMQADRMTRDQGWHLLVIGRQLERLGFLGQALARALSAGLLEDGGADGSGLSALLELFDSSIAYHAQYQQSRDLPALLELLVLDQDNPRAIARVMHSLHGQLQCLAGDERQEKLLALLPASAWQDLPVLCSATASQGLTQLSGQLEQLAHSSWQLAEAINALYFRHVADLSVGA